MLLIQTDLPEPVVPATNRCGMDVRSATSGKPAILLPRVMGSFDSFFLKFSEDIISDNITLSLLGFGISIPTVFLPGIAETLADKELVFLAMSSDKFTILETLIPGAGSNSYRDTTGPLFTFFILPSS